MERSAPLSTRHFIYRINGQFRTNRQGLYAVGDTRCVDVDLMGYSDLPSSTSYGYDTAKMDGASV